MSNNKTQQLPKTPAWQALTAHFEAVQTHHIADYFASDETRAQQFSVEGAGLFLDYSKNRANAQTMSLLTNLARETRVEEWRDAMFAGAAINETEGRRVLHTALRNSKSATLEIDGADILEGIRGERERMLAFATAVREGVWLGHTGKRITDLVNIGIGGSDLGPRMVCEALKAHRDASSPRVHFVANIDGAALDDIFKIAPPETTVFIVASKTFTTIETMTNAQSARSWFLKSGAPESAVAKHFAAVSTNGKAVAAFGIDTNNMFGFWDWVGGRYSVWSVIGAAIAVSFGERAFNEFLAGAEAMDAHFCEAPLAQNMPVVMAILGVWYRNFYAAPSVAILPYSEHLNRFPAYLQQLDMESNGKAVTMDGKWVNYATGPIIWGEPGTNGQHAFFQLLHQGTELIPADFILPIKATHGLHGHHELLVANCLAQSNALMMGKSTSQVRTELEKKGVAATKLESLSVHRTFTGNRPSNTILMPQLDAKALGALVALYEHKVFVQGVIWGLNSFDQWGVELGKVVALDVQHALASGDDATFDGSTRSLMARLRTQVVFKI